MRKMYFLLLSLLLVVPFLSSEVNLFNNVIIDNSTSTVAHIMSYSFDDTSATNIGYSKAVPIYVYMTVQPLPYNLSDYGFYGSVDWCNYTSYHFTNRYNIQGESLNSTTEIENIFFENTPVNSTFFKYEMYARDTVIASIKCHYTDNRDLYADSILFGRLTTFLPSFECKGCEKYSLEELSNQIEANEQMTENELNVYSNIQKIVQWNYKLWLIASWFIKIGLIVISVLFIFAGVFYIYAFLKGIGRDLS